MRWRLDSVGTFYNFDSIQFVSAEGPYRTWRVRLGKNGLRYDDTVWATAYPRPATLKEVEIGQQALAYYQLTGGTKDFPEVEL